MKAFEIFHVRSSEEQFTPGGICSSDGVVVLAADLKDAQEYIQAKCDKAYEDAIARQEGKADDYPADHETLTQVAKVHPRCVIYTTDQARDSIDEYTSRQLVGALLKSVATVRAVASEERSRATVDAIGSLRRHAEDIGRALGMEFD